MNNKSKINPILVIVILIGIFSAGVSVLYAQSNNIICPQCGEENDEGAKFCWNDGFDLSNIQIQQKTISPVKEPMKISPPIFEIKPQTLKTSDISFGYMGDAEIEQFLTRLTERLEAANDRRVRNPNYIGDLTQAEFKKLMENTLQNQNIVRTKVITKKESGFGSFLKAVGATTLIIFSLGILASA